MAARLGVINAFQETLDLCWKRLPALMRIIWGPTLVMSLIGVALFFVVVMPVIDHAIDAMPKDANGQASSDAARAAADQAVSSIFVGFAIPVGLINLMFATMIGVPISRLAGAAEEPEGVFFVRWSGPHTRYAIAYLIMLLVPMLLSWASAAALIEYGPFETLKASFDAPAPQDPASTVPIADLLTLNMIVFLVQGLGSVALILLPPTAAIENRIRIGRALGAGLRHFLPILGGLILIYLVGIVLSIAFALLFGPAVAIAVGLVSWLQTVLVPAATLAIGAVLALAALVAVFAFNCFYYGLWVAFPAVAYRRLLAGGG